ncbi:MAG: N-glycosylase/DNA lyase [Nanoarchaeota archaeon]
MLNERNIKEVYETKKEEIKKAIEGYKSDKMDNELFYEFIFTLLTPQSSGVRCWEIVEDLMKKNFFENGAGLEELQNFLRSRVRFHNNKARYLIEARNNWSIIKSEIVKNNSREIRNWLVENVNGQGMKEASHFLRNIGHSRLAILDRHILRCLNNFKVINEFPRSLSKNKYLEIEGNFNDFSNSIGISVDELDLLFWSEATGRVFK